MKKIFKGILPIYVIVDATQWVLKKFIPGFINLPRKTQRFLSILLILTTLFTGGGVIYLFNPLGTNNVEAAWYDDNYGFRQAITVTVTSSASDITNLETLLTIDTTGITSKLQSACQDLRFTSQSGKLLPYYIDSCSNNSATNKVWVMADLIPKNSTTYTMYMYYGNPSAVAGTNSAKFDNVVGLVGYWTLNDNSGSAPLDSSVNLNNGAFTNTPTWTSSCQLSNCLTFDNSTNYVTVTNNTAYSGASITIETWIYFTGSAGSNNKFLSRDTASPTLGWLLYKKSTEKIGFQASTDGSATNELVSTTSIATNTWYHVVGTYNATNGAQALYVNGVLEASGIRSGNLFNNNSNIIIGGRTTPSSNWPGRLDDAKIYNTARTANQVLADYNNTSCGGQTCNIATTTPATVVPTTSFASEEKAPAPIAYWKFDDATGTTAKDSTTNVNNGTLTNGPTWQTDDQCIAGKCLFFDGSNDYVTAGDPASGLYDFGAGQAFSVAVWVRLNSSVNPAMIVAKGAATCAACESGYELLTRPTSISFIIDTDGAGANNYGPTYTTTEHLDGKWHQIIGVRSGANVYLYFDGKRVATAGNDDGSVANSTALTVGGRAGTTLTKGFIDDVKIYNYARSAAQAQADYNAKIAKGGNVLGTSAQNPPSALSNGLTGYWKMDEASWNGSSGEILDSSGNVNNGTSSNGAATAAGKFGNSGSFDGTDDTASIPSNSSLDFNSTGTYTIATWINPTSIPNGSSNGTSLVYKTNSGNGYGLFMGSTGIPVALFPGASGNQGNGNSGCRNSAVLATSTWTQIAFTWNNGICKFYVNGVLTATQAVTGATNNTSSSTLISAGNAACTGFQSCAFPGKLDELRVYNRELSPADMSTLYNFAPGPIGYWQMDDKTGTTAIDSSGNGFSGTLTNGPTWMTGKYGSAVNFDGSDDNINIYSSSLASKFLSSQGTLSGWMKINDSTLYTDGTRRYAVALRVDSSNQVFFGKAQASNNLVASYDAGVVSSQLSYPTTSTDWNFISITWDKAADSVKIYVNGTLQSSLTGLGTWSGALSSTQTTIGARSTAGASGFKGIVDDIKIYDYPRSASQVVADMNADHPAPGSPVGTPTGYWDMDEGYGDTANNLGSAGSTSNGNLSGSNTCPGAANCPVWIQSGKYGKALNFNDIGDYVDVSNNAASIGTGDVTISTWFRLGSTFTSGSTEKNIYSLSDAPSTDDINIKLETTSGHIEYAIYNGSGYSIAVTSQTSWAANTWYHIAAVFSTTSGMQIYINGLPDGSSTNKSRGTTVATLAYIGKWWANGNHYLGDIDEFKAFNQALTPDQVKLEYNRGQSQVLGALSNNSSSSFTSLSSINGADHEYCVPGDSTSCVTPIGRWDFEEGTGSSVNDSSGNGNTGTWNGTLGNQWKPGKTGKGGNFNGTDNYVEVTTFSVPTTAITYSVWFKPNSNLTTSSNRVDFIYGIGGLPTGRPHLTLNRNGNTGKIGFFVNNGSDVNTLQTTTTSWTANTWYNITATWDGTTAKIYVNGILENSISLSGTISAGTGIRMGSTGVDNYFPGVMDNIRIFNYARSNTQVAWDYNRGAPVANYDLDECQGTVANDSSGNANPGTITIGAAGTQTIAGTCNTSSTAWGNGVTGKRNYSLNFDGTDDYVQLASDVSTYKITGSLTLSAWINASTFNQNADIIAKFINGNRSYRLSLTAAPSALRFDIGGTNRASPASSLAGGSWQHVVGVYNATAQTMDVYINGVNKNGTLSGSVPSSIADSTNIVTIGAESDTTTNLYTGQIDDVRIYNYPLTPTQIKVLYTNGSVNFAPITGAP